MTPNELRALADDYDDGDGSRLIKALREAADALPDFYEDGDITMNKAGCDWVDDLMQKARDAEKRADECEAQWAAWQQKEAEALIRAERAEEGSSSLREALQEIIEFVNKDLSNHDNRWVSRRCAEALGLPMVPVGLPRIDVGDRYCSTCRHLTESEDERADFDCNSPKPCDRTNSGWEPAVKVKPQDQIGAVK